MLLLGVVADYEWVLVLLIRTLKLSQSFDDLERQRGKEKAKNRVEHYLKSQHIMDCITACIAACHVINDVQTGLTWIESSLSQPVQLFVLHLQVFD